MKELAMESSTVFYELLQKHISSARIGAVHLSLSSLDVVDQRGY